MSIIQFDVEKTLKVIRDTLVESGTDQIARFFDGIEEIRKDIGYGEVFASDLLAEIVGNGIAKFNNDVESYLNEEWITVAEAAKVADVCTTTVRRRVQDGLVRSEWRDEIMYVPRSDAERITLMKAPTHKGPRPKKQRNATHDQTTSRINCIRDILSDNADHRVGDVVDVLVRECDFSFNRNARNTALKIITNMISRNELGWHRGNANTKNPGMNSFIFLPGQGKFNFKRTFPNNRI